MWRIGGGGGGGGGHKKDTVATVSANTTTPWKRYGNIVGLSSAFLFGCPLLLRSSHPMEHIRVLLPDLPTSPCRLQQHRHIQILGQGTGGTEND